MGSPRFSLTKEDGMKILKGAVIALFGALLTYASEIVTQVDFGTYTAIVVSLSSVLINAGYKFLKNNS